MSTTKIKTKSGFFCEIDDDAMDDAELLEMLVSIDKGESYDYMSVLERLIGKKQKAILYNRLRNEKGIVSAKAVARELGDIIQKYGALSSKKKS